MQPAPGAECCTGFYFHGGVRFGSESAACGDDRNDLGAHIQKGIEWSRRLGAKCGSDAVSWGLNFLEEVWNLVNTLDGSECQV